MTDHLTIAKWFRANTLDTKQISPTYIIEREKNTPESQQTHIYLIGKKWCYQKQLHLVTTHKCPWDHDEVNSKKFQDQFYLTSTTPQCVGKKMVANKSL